MSQTEVKLVAKKPLPYNKIRMPGSVFYARRGYADLFIRQGLARLGTPDDPEPETAPRITRAMVTAKPIGAKVKKSSKRKRSGD